MRSAPEFFVARSLDEWTTSQKLQAEQVPGQESLFCTRNKPIDFSREMVIGVVLSTAPSGCTGVSVVRVHVEGKDLIATYRVQTFPSDVMCTAALTTAFDVVTVPKSAMPVKFELQRGPAHRR